MTTRESLGLWKPLSLHSAIWLLNHLLINWFPCIKCLEQWPHSPLGAPKGLWSALNTFWNMWLFSIKKYTLEGSWQPAWSPKPTSVAKIHNIFIHNNFRKNNFLANVLSWFTSVLVDVPLSPCSHPELIIPSTFPTYQSCPVVPRCNFMLNAFQTISLSSLVLHKQAYCVVSTRRGWH